MPIAKRLQKHARILDKTRVELKGDEIRVSGPKETVSMKFSHPRIRISLEKDRVIITCDNPSKSETALMGTVLSHIENMMIGVTEGFRYRMKIVFSHFPIKASVKGAEFIVENFLGERSPRKARILGKTRVEVKGDEVILTGPSVQDVGQSAANIEQATMIRGYDPRVFQDGIYIVKKAEEA